MLQALQRRRQARLSRLQLCPVWYPGKGRALLAPRSSGTFFKSKTQAKAAWWALPQQSCPSEVLRWVTHGVKIDFAKKMEPLHLAPRFIPADKIPFVMKDQLKGYEAGAYVDLVPGGEQFLSRSRVHSTTSKDRMVHALLDLNDCTVKKPCTYEQVKDLPSVLRPDDWMISLDAEAAFWSVPVHRDSIKFMSSHFALPASYTVDGVSHQTPLMRGGYWCRQPLGPWTQRCPTPLPHEPAQWVQIVEFSHARLPFGFTSSPRIYTAVARVVASALRREGLRVLVFVDDYLIATRSRAQTLRARRTVTRIFNDCGFVRALGKGQFDKPTQVLIDHLGFQIDSRGLGCLKVPERRCSILRRLSRGLLSSSAANKRRVSSTDLQVFCGTAISCMQAIPQARLRLRSLFDVQEQWRPVSVLKRAQVRDLVWWQNLNLEHPANGSILWPPAPTVGMYTDASGKTGFGSVLDIPSQARRVHGSFWNEKDIPIPICVKELKALKFGLVEHSQALAGRTVRLFQDNQAVVGAMKAFSSSSPAMMVELREVWKILDDFKICFVIEYIRSELNPADAPSRLRSRDLWSLRPHLQDQLMRQAVPVTLDPFACRLSKVCPRYCTPLHDHNALAMNGLLLDWSQESLWLSPP